MQRLLTETPAVARRFARVVLPIPVETPFTYEVPDELAGQIAVGSRVDVPFGRRVLSGVVTELTTHSDVARTRPIAAIAETYLPAPLLDIAEWIATYYGCSLGEAVQSVVPPSLRRAKRAAGMAMESLYVNVVDATLRKEGETGLAFNDARRELSRSKKQLALLGDLVCAGGDANLAIIVREWGYTRAIVEGLARKGYIALEQNQRTSPLDSMDDAVTALTPAQAEALAGITRSIAAGEFSPVLLYGVTGSGKTEVYLRAASRALAEGGGCLVLVPEIGLIPQATARYRRMFGDAVAIIHSRLTGPERFEIWERVAAGTTRIVVGPRSAVFSPIKNLRLVIVDEEQDDSYKQDDKPRYHARSVALMRGKLEKLTVVLGSATPSAESLRWSLEEKYASLRLPERAQGAPLPNVDIVDMRAEEDRRNLFSSVLVERLERNIEQGQQSIVFLNKRGHARFVQCNACGWVADCRNCDISLTYHRVDNRLKCHFCGYSRQSPPRCDTCGSNRLYYSGIGTQRVELELRGLFPGVEILRMDADTTSGKEGHRRVLEEFSTGNYPILLGTQMVTKGHHFPGVSLVGVVYAEEGLNFPDFRSAERTFQQLTQVAGRAGRGDNPGEVVIQTYMPDHYVFSFLRRHDYDGFMGEELAVRRQLRYPPYARIVLASGSSTRREILSGLMARWAERLRQVLDPARIAVLGPAPPLVARVKNRFREQILIKGSVSQRDKDLALAEFRRVAGAHRGASAVDLRWDVDPENFF